jgi:hypothetical protein
VAIFPEYNLILRRLQRRVKTVQHFRIDRIGHRRNGRGNEMAAVGRKRPGQEVGYIPCPFDGFIDLGKRGC